MKATKASLALTLKALPEALLPRYHQRIWGTFRWAVADLTDLQGLQADPRRVLDAPPPPVSMKTLFLVSLQQQTEPLGCSAFLGLQDVPACLERPICAQTHLDEMLQYEAATKKLIRNWHQPQDLTFFEWLSIYESTVCTIGCVCVCVVLSNNT